MTIFDKTKEEESRVSNLKSYGILDTQPENEFEDIILLASVICEAPYCFIGFIDHERIWFKSKIGFDLPEIPLNHSICKYVLESKKALLIEDLEADDFFSQSSTLQNEKKIRFYLSLPLISPEGFLLGTLGVMDDKPRKLNQRQILALSALSRQIIQNLFFRKNSLNHLLSNKTSSLGMFTFFMAHEINHALFVSNTYLCTAIKEYQKEENSDKKIINFLDKIKNSNSRISKIVNGVRIFSRNSENDPLELFSAKKIIRETLSICEDRCHLENIVLKVNLPDDDFFIDCRPSEIIQVLINLINNSIDALSEVSNKWIELEVKVHENNVIFSVIDGGRGIPNEIVQNLTKIFCTSKEPGKGTGLGLFICKMLIQQHSGEFFFDNNLPTKFGFSLPLKLSETSQI